MTQPASATGIPTASVDVRNVPLGRLATAATAATLRRIVPEADDARVPVAAFNASL